MKHIAVAMAPWRRPHMKPVMLGFRRYARRAGWRLTPLYLREWMGEDPWTLLDAPIEGLVAGDQPDSLHKVLAHPEPKVIVGPLARGHGVPCVSHDYESVGRLGVEHLAVRGYRDLVLFRHGDPHRWDAEGLSAGFAAGAEAAGASAEVFTTGPRTAERGRWELNDQLADLADVLRRGPKPRAVLCFDDEHAFRALQAAELAGLRVPEQVAVLGVGDDEFVCEFASPTLSAVTLNHEQVGYLAAQRLDELTDGRKPLMETTVRPLGVVERESTGHLAVRDDDVREALRRVREQLDRSWGVEELADAVNVSPRTLLRKFRKELGRPPGEAVRQLRLAEARRLLTTTDLPLQRVAAETGLGAASQFGHAIKNAFGVTPGQLRRTTGW
jgi:LacI family transcriptional regulator